VAARHDLKGNSYAAGPHKPTPKRELWLKLQDYIMNDGLERYMRELESSDPETFMKHYLTILEFVKPRLQRQQVEVSTNDTRDIKLNFGTAKLLTGGGETDEG
jgi:hypothetical protein